MGWVSLGISALKTDLKPPMFVPSWNAFWTSYLPANFGKKNYGDRHEEYRVNMRKM